MLHTKLRRFFAWLVVGLSLCVAFASSATAQGNPLPTDSLETLPLEYAIPSSTEIYLGILVLAFGLFIIVLQSISLKQAMASPETIMMSFIITSIIVSGLYLVSIGLSDQQIAPVFSLYGAIVGYLLGKEAGKRQSKEGDKSDEN